MGKKYTTNFLEDTNGSTGASNQVLISTPTGIDWVDGSGSSIIGGPYLPLTAGSTKPLTGTLYGTNTNWSGSGDYAGSMTLGTGASTAEAHLTIGQGRTDNGYSYIDLVGDATYTDFGLRIIRSNTGPNTTSGIYHRGTGNLEIQATDSASILLKTNNTLALTLGSNQNATFTGNVEINGTIIGTDQTFGGAYRTFAFGNNANGYNRIFATNNASDGIYINASTGHGVRFRVNGGGTNVMQIDSSGNATFTEKIGIGTTLPQEKLDVEGNIVMDASNARLKIKSGVGGTSGGVDWTFNTASTQYARIDLDYDTRNTVGLKIDSGYPITLDFSYSHFKIQNNGSEKMRVDSSGRVGIGSTSPSSRLTVSGPATPSLANGENSIRIERHASAAASPGVIGNGINFAQKWWSGSAGLQVTGGIYGIKNAANGTYGGGLAFYTQPSSASDMAQRMIIDTVGNVGIGVEDPEKKLEVKSDTTYDGIMIDVLSAPEITFRDRGNSDTRVGTGRHGLDGFHIDTYSGNALFIKGSNRFVGIGTTGPTAPLHILGGSNDTIDETTANLKVQGGGGNGTMFGTIASSPYTSYIQSAYVVDTSLAQYNLALNPIGGNVGIGLTNPSAKLQIAGTTTYNSDSAQTLRVCDATDISKGIHIGFDTTLDAGIIQAADFGVSYRNLLLNPNANNVGIGTTSPGAKLDVAGTVKYNTQLSTNLLMGQKAFIGISSGGGAQKFKIYKNTNITDGYARFKVDRAFDYGDSNQMVQEAIFQRRNTNKNFVFRYDGDITTGDDVYLEVYELSNGQVEIWLCVDDYAQPVVEVISNPSTSEIFTSTSAGTPTGTLIHSSNPDTETPNWNSHQGAATFSGNVVAEGSLITRSVNANVTISGDTSGNIYYNNASGEHRWRADGSSVNSMNLSSTLLTVNENATFTGSVGIGTTSPFSTLEVSKNQNGQGITITQENAGSGYHSRLTFRGSNGSGGFIQTAALMAYQQANGASGYLRLFGGTTEGLQIKTNGSIQLPTYGAGTLVTDASGNITVSSGGGAGGPYLPLAGGTLTGALAGTSASFTGGLSSVGYSGTSGTFSASVTASGNSNTFGNTTTAALSATSGSFSSSVTAAGNSNSFGTTNFTTGLTSTYGNFSGAVNAIYFRTTAANSEYSLLTRDSTGNALFVQNAQSGTNQNIAIFQYGNATVNQGTTVLQVAKDKSYFANCNVGIGETSPDRRLVLDGTLGTASLEIKKESDRIVYLGTGSSAAGDDNTTMLLYHDDVIKVNINTVGDSYLNGGKVAIGLTNPTTHLEVVASQSNSSIRAGGLEMQSYAVNNSWYAENLYYNGGWKLRSNGYATQMYMQDGKITFNRFVTGNAGDFVTPYPTMILDSNGKVGINTTSVSAHLQVTSNGSNGSAGYGNYGILTTTGGGGQATIGAMHDGDGYANLNLGSNVSSSNVFWHISKRVSNSNDFGGNNGLDYFYYNGSGFTNVFGFSTTGYFKAADGATFGGTVTAATYYKSSGTSTVLGTNSSGEVLLRPTAWNLSTAQSSFTTTLATIGTNATFAGSIYANTIYSNTNSSYYIDVATTSLGLNMAGSATFAGDITLGNDLNFSTNGFADISNIGTGAMRFKPSSQTLALTLTGANATFAGSINTSGSINLTNAGLNTIAASNSSNGYLRFLVDQQGVALTLNADTTSTFGGIIYAVDGNKGAPGISFANDTDTGIFRDSSDKLAFATGANTRMIIESNGEVGINQPNPSATLHLRALTTNGVPFKLEGNANTTVEQMLIITSKAYNSSDAWYNLVAQAGDGSGGATNTIIIERDGDVRNKNNSYGQISDIRLKENITDATPKLEDIKKLKVKNFNLIGDDLKQIGLIAQEVEEVFPGLVKEDKQPDLNGEEGGVYKSVKYSVLVPMLIKAMQEQQEQIDELKKQINN